MSRQATAPAYAGNYDYHGTMVQPAMELVKKSLLDLNPEKLSEVRTIPVSKMEEVADKLHAAAPKAFVEIAYRFTRHTTDLRAQLWYTCSTCRSGSTGMRAGSCRIDS